MYLLRAIRTVNRGIQADDIRQRVTHKPLGCISTYREPGVSCKRESAFRSQHTYHPFLDTLSNFLHPCPHAIALS